MIFEKEVTDGAPQKERSARTVCVEASQSSNSILRSVDTAHRWLPVVTAGRVFQQSGVQPAAFQLEVFEQLGIQTVTFQLEASMPRIDGKWGRFPKDGAKRQIIRRWP
ncbi:hypothetical protein M3A49_07740 [Paraburkholderia sp. CNPSo 3076]|uniref:hypothetical protein n=1 Tax=Paraburkholderia sp. CNPSo 3076 TaxID=2940936 RepID=UPI0022502731|nr:hypothetical protein [Paraburkholderia sp. CNPSo 3076]MCX5539387.1 hypothetical protein [Paraburkholderia sp. CNPSo 3076]